MKSVIIFTSESCGPCKLLKGYLKVKEFGFEETDNTKVKGLNLFIKDVCEYSEDTVKYNIRNVPTTLFMDNDIIISQVNGFVPKLVRDIQEWLK